MFCLISCIVSPSEPPLAAIGLFVAIELKTVEARDWFNPPFKNWIVLVFGLVKVFANIFALTPPPV